MAKTKKKVAGETVVEAFKSLFPPISAVIDIFSPFLHYYQEERIKELLVSSASGLNKELYLKKLTKFIAEEKGRDVIYSFINNALLSESNWCCRALGILFGNILDVGNITIEQRVIMKAFKDINDHELQFLIKAHENNEWWIEGNEDTYYTSWDLMRKSKDIEIDYFKSHIPTI